MPFLGKVPMDPQLCKAADVGRLCFFDQICCCCASPERIREKIITENEQ